MSIEFRFGRSTFSSKYICFGKNGPLSHQDTWLPAVIRRKKIISLPLSLSPSFFILFVRTHLRRYIFIAKIITKYRREKHSRISKGANQRNSVLWNLFCPLYHLFASLSSRNAAMLTLTSFHKRELKALSSLCFLKLIVFLNNCTIKSSEVDCLLVICYT